MQLGVRRRRRDRTTRPQGEPDAAAAVEDLITDLRGLIDVRHRPLRYVVARLDVSARGWVLVLDSESPAEDHYWALRDVIRVLVLGVGAAASAVPAVPLRVVRDRRDDELPRSAGPVPAQASEWLDG
ncbi:hypothetical protein [Pseudonocardia sp. N23]|uniref:hypothetical protein n=1 Tax=Pseudonocardia sp. N23 TaxID=1987376 RepID=UPI000BFD93BC|nr:hypothetical protein [Pseudonocardia sp. N23]GAY09623.1 hypothetical protein TOK_3890 [Pseudonocardia sp. N23]